jgi:hypothetical protein
MSIRINGDNTTAAPGIAKGDDTDTGIQFGTDEVSIVTGGTEQAKVDSSGDILIGTSSAFSTVANRTQIHLNGTSDTKVGFGVAGTIRQNIYADATNMSIINQTATGYLRFNTADTERVRITHEGYVQKLAHPAFEVALNTGDNTSGDLMPSHVQINRGGHYSTSTGLFTAPVNGVYCFYYGSIKSGDGPGVVRIYMEVNNVTAYDAKHLRLTEQNGDYAENGSIVWTMYLAEDDQVRVHVGQGSVYGSSKEYFHFGGYFIG